VTPTFDVVIPTLNAASSLARTLAAVATSGASSVTVCDGGSRDDSLAIARRSGAVVLTAPAGRGGQLAVGVTAGSAPWLLFLHADTVPSPGWVETVRNFMASPVNAGKAGYFRLRFDTRDPRARRVERLAAWRCRTLGLPYGDQGLLIARAFYESLGGYRALPLMEDVDIARRIGRRNLVALDADAVTSARRYERDGWLQRPLRNLFCLALFLAGVSPGIVARLYGR
jgi:rSAM/selenodomain-associated transferase 2